MRMDYTDEELEDLAAMRERRLILRALADAKIAECQAMLPAKNWLDMNRQIGAVMAVDRLVVALWSPPTRRRRRSAKPAPRLLPCARSETGTLVPGEVARPAATEGAKPAEIPAPNEAAPIPPPCPKDGEVSAGASRRMTEGASPAPAAALSYTSSPRSGGGGVEHSETPAEAPAITEAAPLPPPCPKDGEVSAGASRPMTEGSSPAPAPDPLLADDDIIAQANARASKAVASVTRRYAERAQVWPDGAPFDAGETAWRKHTLTSGLILPDDDAVDPQTWLCEETLKRCNAIARHRSRQTGTRLDGTPHSDDGPDEWMLSVNLGKNLDHPAGNEKPSPSCLPWWIVRKPPP